MTYYPALFSSLLIASTTAALEKDPLQDQEKAVFEDISAHLVNEELQATVSAPIRTQATYNPNKMHHFALYGEMLCFQPFDTSTIWGVKQDSSDPDNIHDKKYGFKFDWAFGFRLGALFNTRWNDLLLDLNWTRFHTESKNSKQDATILATKPSLAANTITYQLNLLYQPISPYGNRFRIEGKYYFYFDQIDWTLGKKLPLAKAFSLTPFGGVRALIMQYRLRMNVYTDFFGTTEVTASPLNHSAMNLNDKSYAIGLLAGAQGNLSLGKGFTYFLKADAFIGAGDDRTSNHEADYFGSDIALLTLNIRKPSHDIMKTMLDVYTGFEWAQKLAQERIEFFIKGAYEFHLLFDTPVYLFQTSAVNHTIAPSTNVALQGVSLGAGLKF